ncbi:MAG TPA: outer membrane beta-barrel protein [candidate division Zixibacteria bacterium]|nr:outer membrane beta-barrel protein [candidate division Zixibacteria bacterium]
MLRILITTLFIGLILATSVASEESDSFLQSHQAGARVGAWINLGDSPPESGIITVNDVATGSYETNINDGAAYFEAFYGHRLSRHWMIEAALGVVNRGSVTLGETDGATDIGNLSIYDLQASAKYYPIRIGARIHPYVQLGGTFIVGRRAVQFTNSSYYSSNWEEENAYKFSWMAGTGIDIPVATQIGLDFNVRYLPIKFGDKLVTIDNYDALTVTAGVKYLFLPQDQ